MEVFLEARDSALPLTLVQGLSRGQGAALAGGSRSGSVLALQLPGLAAAWAESCWQEPPPGASQGSRPTWWSALRKLQEVSGSLILPGGSAKM